MSEVFLKIVNMSISASWLVLAVLVLRLILKKAPKWVNVLLWGIVAVRLICPFTIESPVSLIPDAIGNGELVSEWMDDYIDDIDIHHPDSIYYDAAIEAGREPISDGEGDYYVVTKHDQLGEPATVENTVMPILSIVWIAGITVLVLYTVISYWRLRRNVDTAVLYKDNIFQSENVSSPFVLGIIKPRIYMPYVMNEQNMEHVIAHEQAHIRRRDHWWKPLGFLLLTIHWFNPLMWVAYILLCRDIELACDEKVIAELGNEQRADYTQALVTCSINRRMIAACPLAFGEVGVKERVKSIMNYKKPAFWIVIIAILSCVIVAVCFLTNPKNSEADLSNLNHGDAVPIVTEGEDKLSLEDAENLEEKDGLEETLPADVTQTDPTESNVNFEELFASYAQGGQEAEIAESVLENNLDDALVYCMQQFDKGILEGLTFDSVGAEMSMYHLWCSNLGGDLLANIVETPQQEWQEWSEYMKHLYELNGYDETVFRETCSRLYVQMLIEGVSSDPMEIPSPVVSFEGNLNQGLNAEIIDIDYDQKILYVKDVDKKAAVFGDRCAIDCTYAISRYNLMYVNYGDPNDVRTIDFSDFEVGDSVVIGMYNSEKEKALNGSAIAEQIQLATQRISTETAFELNFAGNTSLQQKFVLTKERPYWCIVIENRGSENIVTEIGGDVCEIEPGTFDTVFSDEKWKPGTYSVSFATAGASGMTGNAVCYTYKYRLEITGRLNNAAKDTTYILLSNIEGITFEQAWRASGLSSNMDDYFDPADAVFIGVK